MGDAGEEAKAPKAPHDIRQEGRSVHTARSTLEAATERLQAARIEERAALAAQAQAALALRAAHKELKKMAEAPESVAEAVPEAAPERTAESAAEPAAESLAEAESTHG